MGGPDDVADSLVDIIVDLRRAGGGCVVFVVYREEEDIGYKRGRR